MSVGSAEFDEARGRRRDDDLAAVPDGRDAGGPVDIEAAVIVAGEMCLARVETHPYPNVGAGRPGPCAEGSLPVDGGLEPCPGLLERREHRVTLGPDADAAVTSDRVAEQAEVDRVDRVPVRSERERQSHRALDVRPQEGDGPGRQRPRHRSGFGGHRVGYDRLRRSASVVSIAIAASGRSRRIARSPGPPMMRPRTPSPSAMTVAARGASRRTASSPMWSPRS